MRVIFYSSIRKRRKGKGKGKGEEREMGKGTGMGTRKGSREKRMGEEKTKGMEWE